MSITRSGLTQEARLEAVFNCIVRYKRAHDGNSPTFRYISDECAIPSIATVQKLVERLAAQGRIRLPTDNSIPRAIEVTGGVWSPPS